MPSRKRHTRLVLLVGSLTLLATGVFGVQKAVIQSPPTQQEIGQVPSDNVELRVL